MHILHNKIMGQTFARLNGVRTPKILFCGRLSELPVVWPREWGSRFVCKPLWGHSSKGVLLLVNHVELGSGRRFRGRDDVAALYSRNDTDSSRFLHDRREQLFLVEEMIESFHGETPPRDYKFYMFGEFISGLYAVSLMPGGERASDSCESWLGPDGATRVDRHGCVIEAGLPSCGSRTCDPKPLFNKNICPQSPPPLPSRVWFRLARAARTIGAATGVPYRVDIFVSRDGTPVLGEMTMTPMNAHFHCMVPDFPNGTADECYLGRLWHSRGKLGGPLLPPPQGLRRWRSIAASPDKQCKLAQRYLMS